MCTYEILHSRSSNADVFTINGSIKYKNNDRNRKRKKNVRAFRPIRHSIFPEQLNIRKIDKRGRSKLKNYIPKFRPIQHLLFNRALYVDGGRNAVRLWTPNEILRKCSPFGSQKVAWRRRPDPNQRRIRIIDDQNDTYSCVTNSEFSVDGIKNPLMPRLKCV